MKKCRITVVKKVWHKDLSVKYENPIRHACDMEEGEVFEVLDCQKPDGFCDSAWVSIYPYVFALANGAEDLYDGWMIKKRSAMVSCSDGFRPVSFLIETI